MKKMQRKILLIGIILGIVLSMLLINNAFFVKADTNYNERSIINNDNMNEGSVTRGIYTALSISIDGGDGAVWATVRNDLTIFPSTVIVYVELYSSTNYCESYKDMHLEVMNSTGDLNMGQSISARASINGVEKYWQGRMRYKVDSGSWKEEITGTVHFDANGNYIGIN